MKRKEGLNNDVEWIPAWLQKDQRITIVARFHTAVSQQGVL